MHAPNIKDDGGRLLEDFHSQLEQVFDQSKGEEAVAYLHLRQARRVLHDENHEDIINEYLQQGCFVEALVLSKLKNDGANFLKALETLIPRLQSENKVQQIAKVKKAIEIVQSASL